MDVESAVEPSTEHAMNLPTVIVLPEDEALRRSELSQSDMRHACAAGSEHPINLKPAQTM